MEPIYDVEQYKWLYLTSYAALIGSAVAFFRKHYVISFMQFLIYMTSINFWSLPDYSWRRTLDLVVVKICVVYQTYLAYNAEYAWMYYPMFLIGFMFYPLALYFFNQGHKWLSVYSHMALHISALISSSILYLGAIPRANSLLI
jgi:hypothetical protein